MNITTDITLMVLIITTLLLYIIGLIAMVQSINKHKYSKLWLALGLLLFICPPFIFVLISFCEKNEIRKNSSTPAFLKAKLKVNISVAIFIFYYSLYPLFVLFENSISKCNFADKIGKFVFFRARRTNSPLP